MTDPNPPNTSGARARAADLFAELCELAEPERERRLRDLAAEAPALARRVAHLLELDAAEAGPLERARDEVAAAAEQGLLRDTTAAAPAQLGPWRLGARLGTGGMGEVYRSERSEGGFTQQAAVKIVRAGMASEAIVARFLVERQVLARLEHPAIARLLDGGVAPDGRPWFAMELVEGEPITEHARSRGLDVAARLRLVIEVAETVDFAHRSLVVHRDLKPSNVLITADGAPKLLDFGLAKLLEPDADPALTRTEMRALTPAYAAPEQVMGEPVTTATDVYALGVLLYELLTGELPHARTSTTAGRLAEEVSRETVERPSQRLRRISAVGSDVPRRARQLEGDLDTIVLRALAREPTRRYPSAAALADDLTRHLEGRPVTARPDTRRYRLAKFLGRHRVAAGAAVLVTLSLVAGLVAALVSARRAERQALRALEVQEFLVSLFEAADPDHSLGAEVTARQLLDAGVAELEQGLVGEPEVQAALFDTVAQIERRIGRYDSAERLARGAVERRERLAGVESADAAAARLTLAEVLHSRGELEAAAAEFGAVLARLERELAADDALLARARAGLAETEYQRGRSAEALALAGAVLERARRVHGEEHAETARARLALATIHELEGDFPAARREMESGVAVLDRVLGPDHPKSAEARLALAELSGYLGERERAHALFEQATGALRRALGDRHVLVAQALVKRSLLFLNQGRSADADRALEEALAIFDSVGHYEAATCERMLGHSLLAQGRPAEAAARFARAYEQFRSRLGEDHVYTLAALGNLGTARVAQGDPEGAREPLGRAIAGLEKARGESADDLRQPLLSLGEAERRLGRAEVALVHHRRVLAIAEAGVGANHPGAANARREIALDLAALGRAEALGEIDRAIAIRRATDATNPRLAEWLLDAATLAERAGDGAGAASRRREALAIQESALGADHPKTAATRRLLGVGRAAPVVSSSGSPF